MLFITFVVALCVVGSSAMKKTTLKLTKPSDLLTKIADEFEKHGASKEEIEKYRTKHGLTNDQTKALSFAQKLRAAGKAVKKGESSKNLRATYPNAWYWDKVYSVAGCSSGQITTDIFDGSVCAATSSTSSYTAAFSSDCSMVQITDYSSGSCTGTGTPSEFDISDLLLTTCQVDLDDDLTLETTYIQWGCGTSMPATGLTSNTLQATGYGTSTTCGGDAFEWFYLQAGCNAFGTGSYNAYQETVAGVTYYELDMYDTSGCSGTPFYAGVLAFDGCTPSTADDDSATELVQSYDFQANPASTVAVNVALSALLAAVAMFAF